MPRCASMVTALLLVAGAQEAAAQCTDECPTAGVFDCATPTSLRTCGDFDVDPCLEWSATSSCSVGQICQGGACVACGLNGAPCCPAQPSCVAGHTCSGSVCVPAGSGVLCQACQSTSDCAQDALCLRVSGGATAHCGRDCSTSPCPPGYQCLGIGAQSQCIPPAGLTCADCLPGCCPDCRGRVCGFDGCNGSCGRCTGAGEICDVNGQCVLSPDTTPPTTPRDLLVRAWSMTALEITWSASTDDRGVAMYVIDRAPDAVNFRTVGTSTSPRFLDEGLSPGSRRWYRVQAEDTSQNRSPFTVARDGTTLAPPDAGMTPTDAGDDPPEDAAAPDASEPTSDAAAPDARAPDASEPTSDAAAPDAQAPGHDGGDDLVDTGFCPCDLLVGPCEADCPCDQDCLAPVEDEDGCACRAPGGPGDGAPPVPLLALLLLAWRSRRGDRIPRGPRR